LPGWLPDPQHEVVSVHELAHQWFSGMIATNEVAYPMLDEGLTQWACLDFLRSYYGQTQFLSAHLPFGPFELLRAAFAARLSAVPSSLLSADRYSARTLSGAVYARPAVVLEQLADRRGRAPLTAALSRYARTQRFRHPSPGDLWNAFDVSLGPGWGSKVLRKALEGDAPESLQVQSERENRAPSGFAFLPELWALLTTILRGLGP
jgi:aminopeptidase N